MAATARLPLTHSLPTIFTSSFFLPQSLSFPTYLHRSPFRSFSSVSPILCSSQGGSRSLGSDSNASIVGDLLDYLNESWTQFHATAEAKRQLLAAGFDLLSENEDWKLKPGGRYFFTRNMSCLVAFAVGEKYVPGNGFHAIAAHTDSPCLKLKPKSASSKSGYLMVNVQTYGGGLWHTWFDRDLSVAGRAIVRASDGSFVHRLVKVKRPLLRVPTLAIHLDRTVNSDGFKPNLETQLVPLLATKPDESSAESKDKNVSSSSKDAHHPLLMQILSDDLDCKVEDIVSLELNICDTQPSCLGGANNEFIFSGRLDNLASSFCALRALIDSCASSESLSTEHDVRMIALFDNEEVGSDSCQGAGAPTMFQAMRRIVSSLGNEQITECTFDRAIRKSFLVSADMAHGVHPNFAEKHEENHRPLLHKGLVIKHNANQRYATSGITSFLFKEVAKLHDLPIQEFVVRNDMGCGSTIGPILASGVGIRTVDCGIAQLSMHRVVGPRNLITAMSSNHVNTALEETSRRSPSKFANTKVSHGGLDDISSHRKEVPEDEVPSDPINIPIPFSESASRLRGKITNVYYEYIRLNQGISQGRVEVVRDFLNRHPDAVDQWINLYETPLLKACAYGNPEIVKEILRRMTPEQMLPKMSQNASYHTPLTVVAVSGNMEIAEALVTKHPKLLEIPGINGQIPVVVAVENTQMEMARYLYTRTPVQVLIDQDGYHGSLLFLNAIFYNMLGIQIKLPPLPELSRSNEDTLMGKLLKCLSKWTGIDEVCRLKSMHLQANKLLQGISEETLAMGVKERSETVDEALLFAARYGNVDFLVGMIKNNPELLWSTRTSTSSTLFLLAVEFRQEKVFSLLYGLGDAKYLLLADKDTDGNGVLHLAGYPPPNYKLATVVGATLQMQRELQWFKELDSIVPKIEKARVNTEDLTPIEIFRKEHEPMRLEAEKWMKDTAMSCSLVAALIVTVTFAAIFTVPGGTDDNARGRPFHLHERQFVIFIVSDLISCFSACTSVLIFLGVLTARYSFDDFLFSLPAKMIAGLSILFVSIAAMLMAFSSTLFTIMNGPWIVAPTILFACFPTLLFILIQYPLLKEMIFSTYGKGIFDRNMKSWF